MTTEFIDNDGPVMLPNMREVEVLDSDGNHRSVEFLDHDPVAGEEVSGLRHVWNHITPAPYKAYYDAARGAFIEYPF